MKPTAKARLPHQTPAYQRRVRKLTRMVQTLRGTNRLPAELRRSIAWFAVPFDGPSYGNRDKGAQSGTGR